MRLIDSHCHLNADRFDGDLDLVVGGARLAGVERVLVPGWNVASSERALAVVDRFSWMDAAVGVHPHDAARVDDAGWATIAGWATDSRVAAIGETGLDFDRVFSPIPDQLVNLRRNLRLALETGKPAILHCRSAAGARDAQDALVEELHAAGIGGPAWVAAFGDRPAAIVHSYSGPADYARVMVDLGLAMSFSGLVFRRGEEAAAAAAAIASPDR
ncbi:MAG: TatD family hydrolase, partial [Chloroflexi bacterium]|nr:TatD family hydrolase [Chloroflexota bacterium]